MGTKEEIKYNMFKRWHQEHLDKFYNYPVESTEHPYYERVFYTIVRNCNIVLEPQHLFLVYYSDGYLDTCKFPDFIDHKNKIIFEIDGEYHDDEEQKIKDSTTEKIYSQRGYTIYRIKNKDVSRVAYKLLKRIYKL